jgi:hypothetical protein
MMASTAPTKNQPTNQPTVTVNDNQRPTTPIQHITIMDGVVW